MEFIDLKAQYKAYKNEIDEAMLGCVDNADFILGRRVFDFEESISNYVGTDFCISCASGTDALQLIFMAYGLGPGDAIFCPDMTFIASIEPACLMGATPVFCDIDYDTFNISPRSLERQITRVLDEGRLNPKIIVAVDFLGNPADYEELIIISKKYNLILVEDAAQGTGASFRGRRCGSLGNIGSTSFFPSKPLGCYGDGGAVFTDNQEIRDIITSLRVHGKGVTKYVNIRIGLNSRLDTIQAAILNVKLRKLDEEIKRRQDIALKYRKSLESVVHMQTVKEENISSYAQFVICAEDMTERDELKAFLEENGIPSIIYYPNPLNRLPVFNNINTYGESFENSERYANCNLGIPFSAFLSEDDQDKVIETIMRYWRR